MIKRVIGTLVSLAVLATVVFTVIHRDRFHSMLPDRDAVETPSVERLPHPEAQDPVMEDAQSSSAEGLQPVVVQQPAAVGLPAADNRSVVSDTVSAADPIASEEVGSESIRKNSSVMDGADTLR